MPPLIKNFLHHSFTLLVSVIVLAGCSACSSQPLHEKTHTLSVLPSLYTNSNQGDQPIIIVSLQNLLSSLDAHHLAFPTSDNQHDVSIQIGGSNGIKAYLNILKKTYGENLILLESGSTFSSSREPSLKNTLAFIKDLQFDSHTLNENNYIYIKEYLERHPNTQIPTFLSANFIDLTTNQRLDEDFVSPYKVIHRNNKNIALIGLGYPKSDRSDQNTSHSQHLFWEDPVLSFLKIQSILKSQDIHYTIVLIDPPSKEELETFIRRVPQNSIDLIIAAGDENIESTSLHNVPIMYNKGRGRYLNMALLGSRNKVIESLKTIELCHQFYRLTEDCHLPEDRDTLRERIKRLSKDRFKKEDAYFLDYRVLNFLD